ncbi:hypothetical protein NP493_652g03024 [Ridgeia piscesae]|uniref:Carboxypeptidase regulatory-like domain-containing protein n=1 Tax=Ridgeia piscesae TaxID=27915 RepID=A0AAD9KSQ3_RIDPI|nr:hypothetical protein NP493_652g03024 [Ridgeia piscesae]
MKHCNNSFTRSIVNVHTTGFFPTADCSRTCPPGGHLDSDCSVCQCGSDVIEGRVTDRQTSLPLADVNIFTVGREWSAATVSGRDGRFTLSGVCVSGPRLTARKDGYESASQEYVVIAGSSVSVVIYKLGEYVISVVTYKLGEYVISVVMYKLGEYVISVVTYKLGEYVISVVTYKLGEYVISVVMYKLGEYVISVVMYKLGEYVISVVTYKLGEYVISVVTYKLGEYVISVVTYKLGEYFISVVTYKLGECFVNAFTN